MRLFKTAVIVFLLSTVFIATVSAYVLTPYKLNGGIKDRYFTVPSNSNYTYSSTTINYGSAIRDMVTRWNEKVEPGHFLFGPWEDINFIETTDYSKSQLDFYVYEYGNIGWRGVCEFFSNSGTQLSTTGLFPNSNWDWNKAKINVSEVHSNAEHYRNATIGHEMGHALGLAHSETSNAIMYPTWNMRYLFPGDDDSMGIRELY